MKFPAVSVIGHVDVEAAGGFVILMVREDLEPDDMASAVAQLFHEAYERLAPEFGYQTRRESAVPWTEVPTANRLLMEAVAREVLLALHGVWART